MDRPRARQPQKVGKPTKRKRPLGSRASHALKGAENAALMEMQVEAGARLRLLRNLVEPKLSQERLGELLQLDQSTIAKWEDGSYVIHPYLGQVICNRFRITLDFLYRGLLSSEVHRDLAIRITKEAPDLVRLQPAFQPTRTG